MIISRFYMLAGEIAYGDAADTEDMTADSMERAASAVDELANGATRVLQAQPPCALVPYPETDLATWERTVVHAANAMHPAVAPEPQHKNRIRRYLDGFILRHAPSDSVSFTVLLPGDRETGRKGAFRGALIGAAIRHFMESGITELSGFSAARVDATVEAVWSHRPAIAVSAAPFVSDLASAHALIDLGTHVAAAMFAVYR